MNPKLLETPIEEVVPKRKMIVVDSELLLATAFSVLVKNNIYSAPVYDTEKKELLGFVDMLDIVVFLINIIETEEADRREDFLGAKDFYTLLDEVATFRTAKVKNLTDISHRNPMVPVSHNATIKEVLKIFANTGTHRVPVLENPWTVNNILTQSDIIRWLATVTGEKEGPQEHHVRLGLVGQKQVRDVFPRKDQIISVRGDQLAIVAFQLMAHHKISSVAVVDDNGALLSNLSAKDIKVIEPDAIFTKLYRTSAQFVAATRADEINIHYPMIYCKMTHTIEEVIQRLAFMRIHRIYVIDDERRPINVISLGDILRVLVPRS